MRSGEGILRACVGPAGLNVSAVAAESFEGPQRLLWDPPGGSSRDCPCSKLGRRFDGVKSVDRKKAFGLLFGLMRCVGFSKNSSSQGEYAELYSERWHLSSHARSYLVFYVFSGLLRWIHIFFVHCNYGLFGYWFQFFRLGLEYSCFVSGCRSFVVLQLCIELASASTTFCANPTPPYYNFHRQYDRMRPNGDQMAFISLRFLPHFASKFHPFSVFHVLPVKVLSFVLGLSSVFLLLWHLLPCTIGGGFYRRSFRSLSWPFGFLFIIL